MVDLTQVLHLLSQVEIESLDNVICVRLTQTDKECLRIVKTILRPTADKSEIIRSCLREGLAAHLNRAKQQLTLPLEGLGK